MNIIDGYPSMDIQCFEIQFFEIQFFEIQFQWGSMWLMKDQDMRVATAKVGTEGREGKGHAISPLWHLHLSSLFQTRAASPPLKLTEII